MSAATALPTFNMAEPLPGYLTQERIGAGGYGEVWKALAPGGIAKAVKVVYGFHDDERAARELTALNRIKEVRHPFLISLERIEVIDSHLIIVAELATSSLKNLFDQYRQSGLPGIPREELMTHVRDAAEALDYLSQKHSLQHLDIKPENLLLVGGRVKVADFGQVKDLQDVKSSIVSGLTPVYAAPELFDGRPSIHSDQYSLAIVFQEMLTGVLPFEGRTTAQLAAQHLHGRPRIESLPLSDQATIGRALSKNPDQRFRTCCDMVNSLLEVTPNRSWRSPAAVLPRSCGETAAPNPATQTAALPWANAAADTAAKAAPAVVATIQLSEPVPAASDLPPLEIRPEDVAFRPTVFVGIGGLAAGTLQVLQRQLQDRFGTLDSLPALQMVLLDTDSETLGRVTDRNGPAPLPDDAVVLLPLRQPSDYRQETGLHLQWLSRRWIYNIPRSGQTQGLRPLGRLALVDHFDRVRDGIVRAVQAAVNPEAVAATARNTGLPFRAGPPKVFVISSISGGTGSGMVLDVGYLVRKVLRDLGLSDEGVCGVLAHGTARNPNGGDLAVANAYACLGELHHYSNPQYAYPGAAGCDLPPFAPEDAPFSEAYVVTLGENLEPADFALATEKLAKYLYCNAAASAAAFFDKCRGANEAEGHLSGADPAVRTFGLCQLGLAEHDVFPAAVDGLCKATIARWQGKERKKSEARPASIADPCALLATQSAAALSDGDLRAEVAMYAGAAGLDFDPLLARLRATATGEMGADPESYLRTALDKLTQGDQPGGGCSGGPPTARSLISRLNSLIQWEGAHETHAGVCLESILEKHLQELAAGQGANLRTWLLSLVNLPEYRLEGAQRATCHLVEHLRALSRQAVESMQPLIAESRGLEQTMLGERAGGPQWLQLRGRGPRRQLAVDPQLSLYFYLRIEELLRNCICRLTGLILAHVAAVDDKLRNLAADLNRLAEEFDAAAAPPGNVGTSTADAPEIGRRLVSQIVRDQHAEMVGEMESGLEDGLRRAVAATEADDVRRALSQALRRSALKTVLHTLKKVNLRIITASDEEDPRGPAFSLTAGVKAAVPDLCRCGGARRLLLVAPEALSPAPLLERLRQDAQPAPTVVADADEDVLLCYEVEQLPLRHVAAAVLDRRFQNVEVASRLHTRTDVQWSPL